MKLEKSIGFLALASMVSALAVMLTGCDGPGDGERSPPPDDDVELRTFLAVKDGGIVPAEIKGTDGPNRVAFFGENIAILSDSSQVIVSKNGGKDFKAFTEVKALRVDGTAELDLPLAGIRKVFAYDKNFVFLGADGVVITDADGKGVRAYNAADAADGLEAQDVNDIVVSGNFLVIAQNTRSSVIDLSKALGAADAKHVLAEDTKDDAVANIVRLGVGHNGEVFAVTDQAAQTWRYPQGNLKAGPSRAAAPPVAELAPSKPGWDVAKKDVRAVTSTKDGKILYALVDEIVYAVLPVLPAMVGAPATVATKIDAVGIHGFWTDNRNGTVYASLPTGLYAIDFSTNAISATPAVNKAYVAKNMTWVDKAASATPYDIKSDNVKAIFETPMHNVFILTNLGAHFGPPGKGPIRK